VLVEGIVIMASILLALAVDQWWEGRELRREEVEVLKRLAEEFDANATQLEKKASEHRAVLIAGEALLDFTGSSARGDLPVDSLSALVWDVFHTPTYDPGNGVLNSLITSGELGIITDDDLRVSLSGWPSLVRDLKEDEDRAWEYVDQLVLPFMDRQVSLRSLHLARYGDEFGRSSDFQIGAEDLLRSREFENYVAGRIIREGTVIIPLEAVEEGLASIQALLQANLER